MKHIFVLSIMLGLAASTACQNDPGSPLSPSAPETRNATVPGTAPEGLTLSPSRGLVPATLAHVQSETGLVSYSVDACGTTGPACNLEIVKPAGATVRSAHFFAAQVPFQSTPISNGGITLNGTGVTWDQTVAQLMSFSSAFNHYANVTNIVKPTIDAAAPGTVNIPVNENCCNPDGSILAVVFNDPAVTTNHSVNIFFGALNPTGDTFSVAFSSPFSTVTGVAHMSLGISFGFQPSGQFSIVDVEGQRLTNCAGGQDDGQPANGALITAGGTGDAIANPTCTQAQADSGGERSDDELYNLVPFINNGDTDISVVTQNPSGDDNIFFALFYLNPPGTVTTGDDGPPPPAGTCRGQALALEQSILSGLSLFQVLFPDRVSIPFLRESLILFFNRFVDNATDAEIALVLRSPQFGAIALAIRALLGPFNPISIAIENLLVVCAAPL